MLLSLPLWLALQTQSLPALAPVHVIYFPFITFSPEKIGNSSFNFMMICMYSCVHVFRRWARHFSFWKVGRMWEELFIRCHSNHLWEWISVNLKDTFRKKMESLKLSMISSWRSGGLNVFIFPFNFFALELKLLEVRNRT